MSVYRRLRLSTLGRSETWRRVPGGFDMRINPADWLDRGLLFGTYEPGLRRLIGAVLRPGEQCADIGTHKGFFTMTMANAVGPTGHVFAVDPDPRAFRILDESCRRNGFTNVSRYQLALGEHSGTCEFALNDQLGNSSRFPNELAAPQISERVQVAMRTADELFEEAGVFGAPQPLSFVKLDTEGSEPFILQGMTRVLTQLRPMLFLEVNFRSLRVAGIAPETLEADLNRAGYRLLRVDWYRNSFGRGVLRVVPVTLSSDADEMIDIVAVSDKSPYRERLQPFGAP